MNRTDVISKAIDDCIKELYSFVTPHIEWNDFLEENKLYSKKYKAWKRFNHLNKKKDLTKKELEEYSTFPGKWGNKSITECIGPKPCDFYYIPKEIFKEIADSYVYAYKIDSQQELLDTIKILKDYCKEPIVDKYFNEYTDEHGNWHPGYRGYDHPNNLEKEIYRVVYDIIHPLDKIGTHFNFDEISKQSCNKFFEFLDMAGNFYNWNRELNTFNMSVYLGPSPTSNKEIVIENWKKYRNKDIEIDEKQIKREYYGEDELD